MPYVFNDDLSRVPLSEAIVPYIEEVEENCWGWC